MIDVTTEALKDYQFVYDKLDVKFAKMDESKKIEFCRRVKDGWNSPIREIYEDIMRQLYEELALRSKTIEELSAGRQAIVVFLQYKKYIEGKISLFNQKISKDDSSSSALKNL